MQKRKRALQRCDSSAIDILRRNSLDCSNFLPFYRSLNIVHFILPPINSDFCLKYQANHAFKLKGLSVTPQYCPK